MEEHHYLVIKHIVIHDTRGMPARQDCPLIRIKKKIQKTNEVLLRFSCETSRLYSLPIKQEEQCSLVR